MNFFRSLSLTLFTLLLLAFASCGGGESGRTTTDSSPTGDSAGERSSSVVQLPGMENPVPRSEMRFAEGELLVQLAPESDISALPESGAGLKFKPVRKVSEGLKGLWLVRYVERNSRKLSVTPQRKRAVSATDREKYSVLERASRTLTGTDGVDYATPNLVYRPVPRPARSEPELKLPEPGRDLSFTPNDPLFDPQEVDESEFDAGGGLQQKLTRWRWWVEKLELESAWDLSRGSRQNAIAIIDTGIDWDHLDLANRYHPDSVDCSMAGINTTCQESSGNESAIPLGGFSPGDGEDSNSQNDPDNIPDDAAGHGTTVAGITAATGNDGFGWLGVDHYSRLMSVRVSNHDGDTIATMDKIVAAIDYAGSHEDVRVINLSLGGPASTPLKDAVEGAWNDGKVLVAAAGNASPNSNDPDSWSPVTSKQYPAGYENYVIAVGGTRNWWPVQGGGFIEAEDLWPQSNFGDWINLVGPAHSVLVTDSESDLTGFAPDPAIRTMPHNRLSEPGYADRGWTKTRGTSFAAPLVSGVLGLGFGLDPNLTNSTAKSLISDPDNLDPIEGISSGSGLTSDFKDQIPDGYGGGRLNARKFLEAVCLNKGTNVANCQTAEQPSRVDLTRPLAINDGDTIDVESGAPYPGEVRLNVTAPLTQGKTLSALLYNFPAIGDGDPSELQITVEETALGDGELPAPLWLALPDYGPGKWDWVKLTKESVPFNPSGPPETVWTYQFSGDAQRLNRIRQIGFGVVSWSDYRRKLTGIEVR